MRHRLALTLVLLAPILLVGCLDGRPSAEAGVRVENRSDHAWGLELTVLDEGNRTVYNASLKPVRGEVVEHLTGLPSARYTVTFELTKGPGSNHEADQGELPETRINETATATLDATSCQGLALAVLVIEDGPAFEVQEPACRT